MENNKKDRTQLKSYFKSNAVPTEQNFKDFIDANLNQKEDGIAKIPNGALAIQSATGTEELLHFYKSFDDANPTWRISQKPSDRTGFTISDGAGTNRLFIDSSNGNTGISVASPQAKLDVGSSDGSGILVRSGNNSGGTANNQLTFGWAGLTQHRHALKTRHNAAGAAGNAIDFYVWKSGTDAVEAIGTQHVMSLDGNANVGIGITSPTAKLHVMASGVSNPETNGLYVYNQEAAKDAIVAARVNGTTGGNPFLSLGTSGADGWSIGLDNKDNQSLKFANAANNVATNTRMTLSKTGSLGIGVAPSAAKLDVLANDANGILIRGGNEGTGTTKAQIAFGYSNTAQYRHAIKTRHHSTDANWNGIDFYAWKPTDGADAMGSQYVMTAAGNGNVGIGVMNPLAKLHVLATGAKNPNTNGIYCRSTAASADAIICARVSQTGGNPMLSLDVENAGGWSIGVDNNDSRKLKIGTDWDTLTGGTRVTIDRDTGFVGIGMSSPIYPLQVKGSKTTPKTSGNGAKMDYDNYDNGWDSDRTAPVSIMAEYAIASRTYFVCHEHFTFSDARLKNIIGRSNVQEDLATLMRLQVTDYQHIDKHIHGNAISKKVIAQEVEEVYPRAIKRSVETLPDIYAQPVGTSFDAATKELTLEMAKAVDLQAGDIVDIICSDEDGRQPFNVVRATGNTFTITTDKELENLFVYGKQVNDFRTVDYDALFMLGISSIQALNMEVNTLKEEVAVLKTALTAYSA